MTGVDAEILRDKHPEYIEELVEFDAEKAFKVLEKYAIIAREGRKGKKSQLFIFIEECNMARLDQNRYEKLISEINLFAESANMKLLYSTSVITSQTTSRQLREAFDVALIGRQADSKTRLYLGVPDTDDFPEHSFIVAQ
ncbi:MAG TPA: hypothetical protein PLZ58_00830 [Candidatus Saccharibacteria bacterium]|nr:hypothetical protein [Candidatus Saccharibacteria bacterium]HRQ07134.1 hypothetical protein [Candidatus Saccharibacteria bacterium]